MIPETVFGLPSHVLIVHGAVVLVPLAAVGLVLIALVPRWRATFGPLVAIVSVLAMFATFAATMSGQAFEEELALGGPLAEKIDAHEALGLQLRWWVIGLALVAIVFVVLARRGASRNIMIGLTIAAVLVAGGSVVQVIRTGHAGSSAVWGTSG